MKKGFRLYLPLLLSIFLVSGCSGGGTTPNTPNTTNLANLAKKPTTGTDVEIKRINLTGKIIDAVTRKPIDNANVLVYVISNDDIIKDVKNNNKPEAFASPQSSVSPMAVTSSPINTLPASISPTVPIQPLPTVLPSAKPAPLYEEEETIKATPKPSSALSKPQIKSSIKPTAKKPVVKVSPKASKINVKGVITPKVAPSITPVKTDEINEKDIISSLTKIKMNDIQEFETKTGNDGKYWINKVPDSSMIITISADNYRSVSVFNAEANKVEDIALMPLDADKYYSSISGAVVSANNNSLENASVSSSYVIGDSFNIPTTTNISGDFTLEDLSIGERMLVASSKDETGKISSMGFFDVDVKKDNKAYKQKKVTATKDDSKVKELYAKKDATELKKEEPKRDKDALLIKSKAVTEYISIKGKVDSKDKDMVLKNVSIYINFKKKGLPKEEIFFTEKEFTKAEDTFELELPKLENVYSYRLEFTGVNKKGFRVYHNEVGIKKDQKELKVSFMSPISIGKLDFIKKEESNLPIFIWNPVEGASFYKVTLDKQDKNNNISTVWEGVTPFNTAIYPITAGDSKIKTANTYFWSVSAIKDTEKTEKLSFSKVGLANASDISASPVMDFKLNSKDEEIEEIDKKKEG